MESGSVFQSAKRAKINPAIMRIINLMTGGSLHSAPAKIFGGEVDSANGRLPPDIPYAVT